MKIWRLLILSAFLGIAAVVQVGCGDPTPASTADPEVEVVDASAPQYRGKVFKVWKDVGGSQNEDQFAETIPDLLEGVNQRSEFIDGVEIMLFANEGRTIWVEKGRQFFWGTPPAFKEFDEEKVMEKAPESVKMFKQNKQNYIQRARQRYEQEKKRLMNEYKDRVAKRLSQAKDYLLQRSMKDAPCTKFVSLGERIQKDGLDYGLIITDGWADCPNEGTNNIKPVSIKGKLAIVQLTKKTDTQANDEEFSKREGFLHALFPEAQVFPAYRPKDAVEAIFR